MNPKSKIQNPISHRAFTLIELILVMALLVIIVSVTFPSLQNFFRGRNLDSEARRFLSLARYGQSRAASEGVPMVLWIDAGEGTYGLQAEAGYLEQDGKAVEFEVDDGLVVQVATPLIHPQLSQRGSDSSTSALAAAQAARLPALRFSPDGFLNGTNPEYVQFQETRGSQPSTLWVALAPNRLGYEIVDQQPLLARR
jgi:prepilin-type N-terminal cleavage/methylation domain-containing protein